MSENYQAPDWATFKDTVTCHGGVATVAYDKEENLIAVGVRGWQTGIDGVGVVLVTPAEAESLARSLNEISVLATAGGGR